VYSYSRNPLTPVPPSHHPRSKISPTRSLRRLALPEAEQGFLAPAGFGLGEPRRGGGTRWWQACPYLSTRRAPGALARERGVVVDDPGTSLVNNVHALQQVLLETCLNGPLAVNREASRGLRAGFLSGMSLSSVACFGRLVSLQVLNRSFIIAYLPWRAAHARNPARVRRSRRRRILCVLLRLHTPSCNRTSTYTHKTRLRLAGPPALRARRRSWRQCGHHDRRRDLLLLLDSGSSQIVDWLRSKRWRMYGGGRDAPCCGIWWNLVDSAMVT
jgi:hypothetical protein